MRPKLRSSSARNSVRSGWCEARAADRIRSGRNASRHGCEENVQELDLSFPAPAKGGRRERSPFALLVCADLRKTVVYYPVDFRAEPTMKKSSLLTIAALFIILVGCNRDVPSKNEAAESEALRVAIQSNDEAAIRDLVAKGARCNGDLLHLAASRLSSETILLLINGEYDINWTNSNQETALHAAARANNIGAITALVKSGASINSVDWLQRTALFTAVEKGHASAAIALLDGHADPNFAGRSVLLSAIDFAKEKNEHVPLVKRLLEAGAAVNDNDASANSPLYYAVKYHQIGTIGELIRAGAWNYEIINKRVQQEERAERAQKEQEKQAEQARHEAHAAVRKSQRLNEKTQVRVFVLDAFSAAANDSVHGKLMVEVIRRSYSGPLETYDMKNDTEAMRGLAKAAIYAERHPETRVVVNMSWGVNDKGALKDDLAWLNAELQDFEKIREGADPSARPFSLLGACSRLNQLGAILIAAAGNDGSDTCGIPAAYSEVIAVGAAVKKGNAYTRAPHSNYGYPVRVAALESHLDELDPLHELNAIIGRKDLIDAKRRHGTSIATAYVTGKVAAKLAGDPTGDIDHVLFLEASTTVEGFDRTVGLIK
jgi:hypothetical protein